MESISLLSLFDFYTSLNMLNILTLKELDKCTILFLLQ